MKKIIYTLAWYSSYISTTLADGWILWDFRGEGTVEAIKTWEIHTSDIPVILQSMINFMMSIAWTVAIIFIIVWAYKILFGSLSQDKTKWKDTIFKAIAWFAVAALSWFIIRLILNNFSGTIG